MDVGFDPHGFAHLAAWLVGQPGQPPAVRSRTAVGRAYYAVFLAVRAKMEAAGALPPDSRVGHGELQRALHGSADSRVVSLQRTLADLYEARRVADYQRFPSPRWRNAVERPASAGTLVRRAQAALRLLDRIDPRDLR